ncbi:MAG: 30S ribosomal protein S18 [Proteobacteria bacterium]|nr:30S ribosomal protein S18 [Pseudomonadota bacterium]
MATGFVKKRKRYSMKRKRIIDNSMIIDYKKPDVLKKFITERGKIIPSRVSGATHSQQLAIMKAVKRARYLALIPSSVAHEKEKGFVGEMSDIAQAFTASNFRHSAAESQKKSLDAVKKDSDTLTTGDDENSHKIASDTSQPQVEIISTQKAKDQNDKTTETDETEVVSSVSTEDDGKDHEHEEGET